MPSNNASQKSQNNEVKNIQLVITDSSKALDITDLSSIKNPIFSPSQKVTLELPPAIKTTESTTPQRLDMNGKFDLSSFGYYFSKGIYNNITSIFSFAYNNPGTTVGLLATAAAACLAFPVIIPTALTTLTILGLTIGGVKVAQGLISIARAKNGDDIEKAGEQLGDGITTIALSLLSRPTPAKMNYNFNKDMITQIAKPALYLKLLSYLKQAYNAASDITEAGEYLLPPKKKVEEKEIA